MNLNLRSDIYGPIHFVNGVPPNFSDIILPQAVAYHARGPWGIICFQEIRTQKFLLRHFLFALQTSLSFNTTESGEGLQALLSLKGRIQYNVKGLKEISLDEKEYMLLDAGKAEARLTVLGSKLCSLLNVYYSSAAYVSLLPLFPSFENDLQKALYEPHYFLESPKIVRHTVHDALEAIWMDRYIPALEKIYIEMRMQTTLFTLLAQAYTESPGVQTSPLQREKAAAARDIILQNIKVRLPLKQIAAELQCSPAWLKKAFGNVYGIGMYHFLRRTRMETAKRMLLNGESLKAVAIEVGMKPRNFPKEFKTFFGYTVTSLKKGRI